MERSKWSEMAGYNLAATNLPQPLDRNARFDLGEQRARGRASPTRNCICGIDPQLCTAEKSVTAQTRECPCKRSAVKSAFCGYLKNPPEPKGWNLGSRVNTDLGDLGETTLSGMAMTLGE